MKATQKKWGTWPRRSIENGKELLRAQARDRRGRVPPAGKNLRSGSTPWAPRLRNENSDAFLLLRVDDEQDSDPYPLSRGYVALIFNEKLPVQRCKAASHFRQESET